jgi:dTDP-4-amino-4,6-dideoxygalactose transaminase
MSYSIPFTGVARQYQLLRDEILDASDRAYRTGQVLDGPYTQMFERHVAQRCMRQYGVAVNSGTQALLFAQLATARSKGIEKIMIPGISFVATLNSVLMAGNEPVYCDVDHNALLDIETIDYALDGHIDTVMYVNMFGNVLDYNKLLNVTKFFNEDVKIIEDAAQGMGSFFNNKHALVFELPDRFDQFILSIFLSNNFTALLFILLDNNVQLILS